MQQKHAAELASHAEKMNSEKEQDKEKVIAALQEQTKQGLKEADHKLDKSIADVHTTLEGLLRETFKIEDGARLSSL